MRFLKLKMIIALGLIVFGPLVLSEEKEGGAATEVPKEQKEFVEKSGKLNTLINRITDAEAKFAELVHHKEAASTSAAKQEIIKEMVEVTNQRNKDVEAYNSLKSDLALRYPNQGEKLDRQYRTQTKRSVEELEGGAGLDEMLTSTKKLIEKKYAPFLDEEDKESGTRTPAHVHDLEEPKRLRLEK